MTPVARYDTTATNSGEPTVEPVSLAELKRHLRIDGVADAAEDETLTAYIRAARQAIETHCNVALMTQHLVTKLDAFRDAVELPRAPLQQVTQITYVDDAGATQTLSTDVYQVDTHARPGRVMRAYGQSWPATRAQANAVTIRYRVGFGDTAANVPEQLKHALKLLCGHWYMHRELVVVGNIVNELPWAVDSLLAMYRVPVTA